jgi:hypothetical protein
VVMVALGAGPRLPFLDQEHHEFCVVH